ncbi:MAG: acyltransferase [Alphaproteobacteria bacterium]|nr:acyltransferase [Alphaproteobacteria bacterium]MBU1526076.1 acyltransferase [Alphaproteobacteria bacterium]MBU2116869.1 acyltransferase [Alphaproteobacteria bacterium]MBU2350611.1 acyltransferase [Alphaproteobacteria bacterium]MBU2382249.1 acyltransferase [Alphaproteobacteria bacterium]
MTAVPSPDDAGPIAPADLRPLTALRFVAAAWVVLYTCWPFLDVGFTPHLAAKGYLGVELFFVLSGFILSHVYLEAFGTRRFGYKGFLWARIARVYPLHLVTLLGVMALAIGAGLAGIAMEARVIDWASLPANLLMLHAWGLAPEAAFNHPSWSISAEWFAYLTFPAFAAAAWALRARPWLAVVAVAAALLALYVAFQNLAGFPLTQATIRWGALRIVPCFALGCALYLVHRRGGVARPGLLSALALVLIVAAASVQAWDGFIVLLGGMLILSLASLDNVRAGPLSSRFAVWLGEISYALYMVLIPWTLVAVNGLARLTGDADKVFSLPIWLGIVFGAVVAAAIAHHLVEKPARTWLRRLPGRGPDAGQAKKIAEKSPARVSPAG